MISILFNNSKIFKISLKDLYQKDINGVRYQKDYLGREDSCDFEIATIPYDDPKSYYAQFSVNIYGKDAIKLEPLHYKIKKPKKIMKMDGVSVYFDDYWFNVRPSNTEPLLRLNLEADSKELMEEKTRELIKVIGG